MRLSSNIERFRINNEKSYIYQSAISLDDLHLVYEAKLLILI